MEERAKKVVVLGSVAASVVMLISLLIIVIVQMAAMGPLKSEKARREAHLAQILAQKESLTESIKYLEGSNFIEDYARYVLGWGLPDSIKYKPKQ